MTKAKKAYLLTGSNLGDSAQILADARRLIGERIGEIVKSSHLYQTQAWGNVEQPDYFNQALEVATALSPEGLLAAIIEIEKLLGRTRRTKWESRLIDIDILFYDHLVVKKPDLVIPHPLLHKRNFVLIPMLEIAPAKRHPVLLKTIEDLYESSEDELEVFMMD
jgi:2-amino-4-hydroxy-6-hydroxymethyldihydropteridine diphosphokinase